MTQEEHKNMQLMKKIKELYKGQSRNYKQKLLYKLLLAVRNEDKNSFTNILFTNLNGIIKDEKQRKTANEIIEEFEKIKSGYFENYAYAIIAGILTSEDNYNEITNERGEQNE
ncbi:MAG: hypothetical protein QXG18_02920 [Candidatus Pacearchaeota archaeon]